MRATNARPLNGGVSPVTTAMPKKAPKRPTDSSTPRTHAPRSSNGRSASERGWSTIEPAAIDPQCPEREVRGVQVVLEHEDPGEAGAVPEPVFPGTIRPLPG